MYWKDEGYLLSKNNFDENSIIIEVFTLDHGKCSGIVYGGNSRKNKKTYQVGNKILIHFNAKNVNTYGYFTNELILPISATFFDDKRRAICILSACTILKILLPERQLNKKIYSSFEILLNKLNSDNWIKLYILWELSLIKELGFEINLPGISNNLAKSDYSTTSNSQVDTIPKLLVTNQDTKFSNIEIIEALNFSKNLLLENFVLPNGIKLPYSRNILEKYFN